MKNKINNFKGLARVQSSVYPDGSRNLTEWRKKNNSSKKFTKWAFNFKIGTRATT